MPRSGLYLFLIGDLLNFPLFTPLRVRFQGGSSTYAASKQAAALIEKDVGVPE